MKTFFIVSVKDELTGAFLQPTFGETVAELERLFAYQINNIDLWKCNAGDYTLYKLGTFDQEEGTIIPSIERLVNGRAVLRRENSIEVKEKRKPIYRRENNDDIQSAEET